MVDDGAPTPFEVAAEGATIDCEHAGEGATILLLHGVTATRRYVVQGSRLLERGGHRVISYDARGHGESSPAGDAQAYDYRDLVADLLAVLDAAEAERAVLVGNSMGAATAIAFALAYPERVSALVQVSPAYAGEPNEAGFADWERLSEGLRSGGADGFLSVYEPNADPRWHDTIMQVTRQRLERHRHPEAVADALLVVPRSAAFEGLEELEEVEAPTLVVGSRDEADPGHPLWVAEAYAERLPDVELIVEEEGKSPLAWQGAQLSRAIADFLERRGVHS